MQISKLVVGAALAAIGSASAAGANVVYSNPYDLSGNGDCSFSTTCAAAAGRGDDFAAQAFTVTTASVITDASFIELDDAAGLAPSDVNWGLLLNDGAGGLPGTIIASGTDTITASNSLGADGVTGLNLSQNLFTIGSVYLAPGTYYFAIQGISAYFDTFLASGVAASGAAETHDGGATWTTGYQGFNSVAVSLNGYGVPEPSTWAMMLVGFGGLGLALRGRKSILAA